MQNFTFIISKFLITYQSKKANYLLLITRGNVMQNDSKVK